MIRPFTQLIFFLLIFVGSTIFSFAQTTVDFNEITTATALSLNGTDTYDNSGVRFQIFSGTNSGANVSSATGGSGGTRALDDTNLNVGGVTGWKITKVDGTAFQLTSIWLQNGCPACSANGTIKAFSGGAQVGTTVNVNFDSQTTGVKNFAANPDFYNIDEIRVEGADLYVYIDNFSFGTAIDPVDADPPVVTGISLVGTPLSTATSVNFTVTFSKDAKNVSSDDFQLTTAGTTGTVGAVSGSGSSYTVTVNGIDGEGTIRLDLKAGTNIANVDDTQGTPAFTSGQLHYVGACFIETFETETDASNTFTGNGVNFSLGTGLEIEKKTGFGAGGSNGYVINNNTAGSFSLTNASEFTMSTIDLYLSNTANSSAPTATGTITITGKKGGVDQYSITKNSGFPTTTAVNGGFFTINFSTDGAANYRNTNVDELVFTISGGFIELAIDNMNFCEAAPDVDNQAPVVQNISKVGNPLSTAGAVNFQVAFDEDASNVTLDDFTLIKTGTATGDLTGISGSGSIYTLSVTGISGEGSIQIKLNAGTDIQDALSNTPPFEYLDGEIHLVGACYIETFETFTDGATSFSSNGKAITLAGNWAVKDKSGFGINSSSGYLENTGTGPYTLSVDIPVKFSKLALFLTSNAGTNPPPTNDGSVTIRGKNGADTEYTITKSTGFPTDFTSNNGFFYIDFATEGGVDNTNTFVDGLEIETAGSFIYLALDNLEFCSDFDAPEGYAATINQDPIRETLANNVSFTFADAEIGATYNYTFSSDGGGTNVTGSGTIATATDQITGIDLSGLGVGTVTLSVTLTDPSGNTGLAAIDTKQKIANIVPVATAPVAPVVTEDDTAVPLSDDIQVADGDGDDQTLTFTITGGTVTIGTTGLTFGGSGNGSANFTASGTLVALNTALDAATFTPTTGLSGTDAGTIGFITNDGTTDSNNATVTFSISELPRAELSIVATTQAAEDATNGVFTVSTSEQFTTATGVVFAVTGTAEGGADFTDIGASFTFPANTNTITIDVPVIADNLVEADETVIVTLTGTDNAAVNIGATDAATVTITDNDVALLSVAATTQASEDASDGLFTISTTNQFSVAVSVDIVLSGTATEGIDYATIGTSVIFPANQRTVTVPVDVTADNTVELDETVIFTMTGTNNQDVSIGATDAATVTITDNDLPPSGYSVAWDDLLINAAEAPNATFTVAAAQVGATINYSVSSAGDGNTVSVTATMPAATSSQEVNVDLSSLTDGVLTVAITLTDLGGNTGAPASDNSATLDQAAPPPPGTPDLDPTSDSGVSDTDNITNDVTPLIRGTAGANTNVTVTSDLNGILGTVAADVTGNWSLTSGDLSTGRHQITAMSTDLAGNISGSSDPLNLTIDTKAPVPVLTSMLTKQLDINGNITVTASDFISNPTTDDFSETADIQLVLDKNTFDCSNVGGAPIAIKITATDEAGNSDFAISSLIVKDDTAPVARAMNTTLNVDAFGTVTLLPGMIDNGSSDNCNILSRTLSKEQFDRTDVGPNNVTLTVSDESGNISSSVAVVTVVVVPKILTITTDQDQSEIFGTTDPAFTYTATGFEGGDDESILTGVLTRVAGEDVGTYAINQGTLDVGPNYAINFTGADFEITPATITEVTFSSESFVFDGTARSLAITGTLPAGTSVAYTNNGRTDAGTQEVTATISGSNYTTLGLTADLTIAPGQISGITFGDDSFVYDGASKSLSITGTLPTGTSAAYTDNNRTDAGTQEVTATITGPNYTTLLLTADLTITTAPIFGITFSDDSFVYDGTSKSLSIAGTLPAGTSVAYTNNGRTDVGTQEVTATVAGSNFIPLVLNAELEITSRELLVSADANQSKVFGQEDPELTFTVSGFIAGDDESMLTGDLSREAGEEVGIYAITRGSLNGGMNYKISFTGGDFEIITNDTDKDGVPDDVEERDGTDPEDPLDYQDNDWDDVPDYIEEVQGTNPTDPGDYLDTDGDDVPDYVEERQGTNPNDFTDAKDSDKDGVPDYVQDRSIIEYVPQAVTVAWGTPESGLDLSNEAVGVTGRGEFINLPVSWNLLGYNSLIPGEDNFFGTADLPSGILNSYTIDPVIAITVQVKPVPQEVTLSGNSFLANPDQVFQEIGDIVVVDPSDDMHTLILPEGVQDNGFFELVDGVLFWSSAEQEKGRTQFTIQVSVTDRAGNVLEKNFQITRTRMPLNQLDVPNTFTPNNDGVNDAWGVPALRYYQGVQIEVFEIGSGKRVFFTENPDIRWDGGINGKDPVVTSYVWVISVKETDEVRRGMLNLLKR